MGAAESSLFILDRVQRLFRILVNEELFSTIQHPSYKRDVANHSLLYRIFGRRICSDGLYYLVPLVLTFTTMNAHNSELPLVP